MTDEPMFKEYMTGLGEMQTPPREISDVLKDIYWRALKPYTDDQCKTAFNRVIDECKFFPKPCELIEFITGGQHRIEDTAEVQAALVLYAIKARGAYNTVCFSDTVTNAVVAVGFGGWIKVCRESSSRDEKWFIRDFVRIYAAYARQRIEHSEPLPGIVETENNAHGFAFFPKPILITGKRQERLTYEPDAKNDPRIEKNG